MQGGNLCPFKVSVNDFGTALIVDDGFSWHGHISENWIDLNRFHPEKHANKRNKTNS